MRVHYPRTPHLPWSPGVAADDVRVADLSGLVGRQVVVTEKLDGENTTLYPDGLHARSLDSAHHPSRAWVKALHGRIAHLIPAGWRVCGENLYARHSIAYADLPGYFVAFSVWAGDECLGWDDTVRFTRRLGVPTPAVLWRGVFDERVLRALRPDPARQEGYVVRAVDAFDRARFGARVAKWVRPAHVRTDRHWMLGPVVPNGLGPTAPLWEVRSGGIPDLPALLAVTGLGPAELPGTAADAGSDTDRGSAGGAAGPVTERVAAVVADAASRLDLIGRSGESRLAGVLAALLHRHRRPELSTRLVAPLGVPLARRVADLVGLADRPHRDFPDEARRAGLVRLAAAADLGVLHAVSAAVLTGRDDPDADRAREQVQWSALHAEEAGLTGPDPLGALRTGLRAALSDLDREAADRCWAQAWQAYADGRLGTVDEAVAATWRWRSGDFGRLVVTVGVSGSGKSTFARALPGVDTVVALDDLRQARGSRADQRANPEVLREGLARLERALTDGATVVWDATALNRHQRGLVRAVAERRDALCTYAVFLVDADTAARRNAAREHPVPAGVLAAQAGRFDPAYPGEAHRAWYVGPDGTVADTAGTLTDQEW